MPVISRFYGIVIMMYFKDKEHNPPHIHAIYGDYEGLFWIATGEMRDGTMPKKAQLLVKEFIEQYRDELLEMWNSQNFHELEPLE
ncbi:MAG: DUF4160 domain-containing protein [Lachnospiraceae bacterium]|nr:DUF4160 domain-containing protein [Lachnospiraceae bacterium]